MSIVKSMKFCFTYAIIFVILSSCVSSTSNKVSNNDFFGDYYSEDKRSMITLRENGKCYVEFMKWRSKNEVTRSNNCEFETEKDTIYFQILGNAARAKYENNGFTLDNQKYSKDKSHKF